MNLDWPFDLLCSVDGRREAYAPSGPCFLRTQPQGEEIQALLLERKALGGKSGPIEREATQRRTLGPWCVERAHQQEMLLLAPLRLLLSCSIVSDSCDPMTPAGSSVRGILPARRILEWAGPFSSRGLNPHLLLFCIESGFCTTEPPGKAIGNEKLNSIHQVCMEPKHCVGLGGYQENDLEPEPVFMNCVDIKHDYSTH